jgi:hypothetical protein
MASELQFKGTYTTVRDGGLTYHYEGFWFKADSGIVWRARIQLTGKFAGSLHGHIVHTDALKQELAVRDAITDAVSRAIEDMGRNR